MSTFELSRFKILVYFVVSFILILPSRAQTMLVFCETYVYCMIVLIRNQKRKYPERLLTSAKTLPNLKIFVLQLVGMELQYLVQISILR